MSKIKAGIIGGAGYTGGELIRLLLLHPNVEIVCVQSNSQAGGKIYETHVDLQGETELIFSSYNNNADVLFLCGGHDTAKKYMSENELNLETVVIDLSQDFRHHANNAIAGRNFIYGLPELNKNKIVSANSIANPGCFATCIELALLPLAKSNLLANEIHINATTGSTGAGQELSNTTHFTWRNSNVSV